MDNSFEFQGRQWGKYVAFRLAILSASQTKMWLHVHIVEYAHLT
jgi:hypothetical protein